MPRPPSDQDLFPDPKPAAPLAELMRPQRLEDVVGQRHLLDPGKPLEVAARAGKLHSMILWGPPGVGKTTLARLLARACNAEFIALSAVFSGVKDIREAVAQAQHALRETGRHTILFVDEVHRFNKAQQDAFLPFVEQGLFTFIGATTENPSFEVNSALLSRAAVHVLDAAGRRGTGRAVRARPRRALAADSDFSDEARRCCSASPTATRAGCSTCSSRSPTPPRSQARDTLDEDFVRDALAERMRRFDKGGDVFYDQISALHKSVRGSSPDAALYWLTRMLDGGADPLYIGRRLVRMAAEDIGLADPRALRLALDACETYERLGSPEGELALAQAAIYLACAPKSNAAYVAYNAARDFVARDGTRPVPLHLRNAPTRLMKELGFGKAYRYAQDEPEAYAAGEDYFPEGMPEVRFYQPDPARVGRQDRREARASARAGRGCPASQDRHTYRRGRRGTQRKARTS